MLLAVSAGGELVATATSPVATGVPVDAETLPIKAVPYPALDVGDLTIGASAGGVIRLVNTGDRPVHLAECTTNCSRMVTNCPRDRQFEPGEEIRVEVSKAWCGAHSGGNQRAMVRFHFENDQTLSVRVEGRTVAFVVAEPDRIDPEQQPDGRMVVRAMDGQAFRITKITPGIVAMDRLSAEPRVEHVIHLDWERWKELGSARKLRFYTDHPKTERIMATVHGEHDVVATRCATRPFPPKSVATAEAHIKAGQVFDLMKLIEEATGFTPVIWAAAFSQDPNTLGVLIEAGANLEAADLKFGMTPLLHASRTGNVDKIRILVAAGANLEARDRRGRTPLLVASSEGDGTAAMVQALIDAGADLEAKDADGRSALDLARKRVDVRGEAVRNLLRACSDLG